MKRKKVDGEVERQILIALITSKQFLSQAAPVLQKEIDSLRDSPLLRLIAEWCLSYHADYQDAPRQHVEAIYHGWSEEAADEDLSETVHDLLEDLSGTYEESGKDLNVPFLLSRLGKMLTRKKLTALQEDLDAHLSRGDAAAADTAVQEYRTVEVGETAGIDPTTDRDAWGRAFSGSLDSIVEFPGAAGRFLNPAMTRDAVVAVQAPEKTGKTHVLLEVAWQALKQRRRVAFFQVGDLSESQIMMRIGVKLAGIPSRILDDGVVRIPKTLVLPSGADAVTGAQMGRRRIRRFKHPLTEADVHRARRAFNRAHGIPQHPEVPYFQLSVHPMDSISVRGVESVLDRWVSEKGFVADVVVLDYADILAAEPGKRDEQDEVNSTWKALRRMSQTRHALVVTATQANAQSYGARTQTMKHFSRDKRKLAHVTGMFALNQTSEEKERQIMRYNWIVLRESNFNVARCLHVGTAFSVGQAMAATKLLGGKSKEKS